MRRVLKDLRELPTTLKNGFQSQLDRIVNQTAAELVGEYSWVRPLWEESDSATSTSDTNSLDIENLLADLNAGTELNSASVDPEAWNRMLYRTLGSVDGSPENYFDENDVDLSSFEIAEVIPVDELEINDIINNHLNDENVVDYLNNSIDDFEELNLDGND